MSEGRNILISGQTGSGKSFLLKRLLADRPRVLVYLTKREEAEYEGVYFDGMRGQRDVMLRWWQYAKHSCNRYRIVYRPADKWNFDEFNRLAGHAYLAGDIDFVCEDVMGYIPATVFKQKGVGMEFKSLLTDGRTRGCNCWLLTQRPRGIPIELRSEARESYVFRSTEPGDVDYISKWLGRDVEEKMQQLNEYEHIHLIQGREPEVGKCS